MILLAGAGDLTKSFLRISARHEGTDERDLLTARDLEFLDARYRDQRDRPTRRREIIERLERIPGAQRVGVDTYRSSSPVSASDRRAIRAEGVATARRASVSPRFSSVVTPGYFATDASSAPAPAATFDAQPIALVPSASCMINSAWPTCSGRASRRSESASSSARRFAAVAHRRRRRRRRVGAGPVRATTRTCRSRKRAGDRATLSCAPARSAGARAAPCARPCATSIRIFRCRPSDGRAAATPQLLAVRACTR